VNTYMQKPDFGPDRRAAAPFSATSLRPGKSVESRSGSTLKKDLPDLARAR
jgi:hypothetical protein